MDNNQLVQARLESELNVILDKAVLVVLKPMLVNPRCEMRDWDYGEEGQSYPCWIVAEHHPSNTCIAYCEHGFGPSYPWGLLFIAGEHLSMGMDSGWYASLEDALRESMAWDFKNPSDFEVE